MRPRIIPLIVCITMLAGCSGGNTAEETTFSELNSETAAPVFTEPEPVTTTETAAKEAIDEEYSYFENCYFLGGSVVDGAVRDGVLKGENTCPVMFSERLLNAKINGKSLAEHAAAQGKPYIYISVGEGDIMADVDENAYATAMAKFVRDLAELAPDSVITVLGNFPSVYHEDSIISFKDYNKPLEREITRMGLLSVHYLDISLVLEDGNSGNLCYEYSSYPAGILTEPAIEDLFAFILENRYTDVLAGESKYRYMLPDLRATRPEYTVTEGKVAYLTFDDGPSPYTEEILDILSENDIKATFFVTGISLDHEGREEILKREVQEGHVIGLHSYTHEYDEIYATPEVWLQDYRDIYKRVKDITGVETWCFRFPGGSYNNHNRNTAEIIQNEMSRRGFAYWDWNCATLDAERGSTVESCIESLKDSVYADHSVVLMHDASDMTPVYLQSVINYLRSEGYTFETVETADEVHFRRPESWGDSSKPAAADDGEEKSSSANDDGDSVHDVENESTEKTEDDGSEGDSSGETEENEENKDGETEETSEES